MYEGTVCYASSAFLAVKTEPKTFSAAGMNIVLDSGFVAVPEADAAAAGCVAGFDSESIAITVTKELPEVLAAVGLGSNLSVEGYANAIITLYQLNSIVENNGSVTYFTYNTISGDTIITVFAAVYKSVDAYWLIQFLTEPSVYPTVKANIMGYAESVTFG